MTAADPQFWDALLPLIGPLPPNERAAAVAHAIAATRGQDIDAAALDRLALELRERFTSRH